MTPLEVYLSLDSFILYQFSLLLIVPLLTQGFQKHFLLKIREKEADGRCVLRL